MVLWLLFFDPYPVFHHIFNSIQTISWAPPEDGSPLSRWNHWQMGQMEILLVLSRTFTEIFDTFPPPTKTNASLRRGGYMFVSKKTLEPNLVAIEFTHYHPLPKIKGHQALPLVGSCILTFCEAPRSRSPRTTVSLERWRPTREPPGKGCSNLKRVKLGDCYLFLTGDWMGSIAMDSFWGS